MIGPVFLVVVVVLIWATVASRHQHRAERGVPSPPWSSLRPAPTRPVDDLDERLDRWVGDDLLTADQASAIRAAEAERLAAFEAASPPSRIPMVAEALAYLGGTLVIIAALVVVGRSWEDLGTAARVALPLGAGAVVTAAGAWLRQVRPPEPAYLRATSLLWLLGAGGIAAATGIWLADGLQWTEAGDVAAVVALVSATVGGVMLVLHRYPLQLTAFAVAVAIAGATRLEELGGRGGGVAIGWWLWGLGLVGLVIGWKRWLEPVSEVSELLGAVGALVGPWMIVGHEWVAVGYALGIATALALLAASIPTWRPIHAAAGVIGLLMFVTGAILHATEGAAAAPVALLVAGLLVLAAAAAIVHHHLGGQGRHPHDHHPPAVPA